MPARFHEISLATPDIRASMEFYQALGFQPVATGDVLPHRYGAVTDGRLVLGLHAAPQFIPGLTFVRPGLAPFAFELEARGLQLEVRHTHPETFNEIALDDPEGCRLRLLEAPIHASVDAPHGATLACGEFTHLSLPARDLQATTQFWEQFGFVALGDTAEPYAHHALTSDRLNLGLHSPRLLDAPALVFYSNDAAAHIAALRDAGITPQARLPRGLPRESALFEAPEGTLLLVLAAGNG